MNKYDVVIVGAGPAGLFCAYELVENNLMKDIYIKQVKEMAAIVYSYGLNIDYFPTNFIVQDNLIYYIDYECNQYMDEWNLENWGIKYWYKTNE